MDRYEILVGFICIVFVGALISALIIASHKDHILWEAFRTEHNCKAVNQIKGDLISTSNGFAVTPDKTGWLCDDGVTYYR